MNTKSFTHSILLVFFGGLGELNLKKLYDYMECQYAIIGAQFTTRKCLFHHIYIYV